MNRIRIAAIKKLIQFIRFLLRVCVKADHWLSARLPYVPGSIEQAAHDPVEYIRFLNSIRGCKND